MSKSTPTHFLCIQPPAGLANGDFIRAMRDDLQRSIDEALEGHRSLEMDDDGAVHALGASARLRLRSEPDHSVAVIVDCPLAEQESILNKVLGLQQEEAIFELMQSTDYCDGWDGFDEPAQLGQKSDLVSLTASFASQAMESGEQAKLRKFFANVGVPAAAYRIMTSDLHSIRSFQQSYGQVPSKAVQAYKTASAFLLQIAAETAMVCVPGKPAVVKYGPESNPIPTNGRVGLEDGAITPEVMLEKCTSKVFIAGESGELIPDGLKQADSFIRWAARPENAERIVGISKGKDGALLAQLKAQGYVAGTTSRINVGTDAQWAQGYNGSQARSIPGTSGFKGPTPIVTIDLLDSRVLALESVIRLACEFSAGMVHADIPTFMRALNPAQLEAVLEETELGEGPAEVLYDANGLCGATGGYFLAGATGASTLLVTVSETPAAQDAKYFAVVQGGVASQDVPQGLLAATGRLLERDFNCGI